MRGCFLTIPILLMCSSSAFAAITITFDSLNGYNSTGATGSYFDGYGATASTGSWATDGATFNTKQFGPGWSYSNVNDTMTAGFTNQWAAAPGTGVGGSGNYVVGSSFSANGAYFNLPTGQIVESINVTNATYPAISMRDGDAFAKKFGGTTGNDPDLFRVTFTGFSGLAAAGTQTGSSTFTLADYRFANNALDFIVNDWQLLDLTPLGNARSVGIGFETTDNGQFGPNTPVYAAIDNLTLTSVPEPGCLALLSVAGLAVAFVRKQRRQF